MSVIGGQYRATAETFSDGQIVEALPTDGNGNLMVNIAAGETINIGTVNLGTVTALQKGTITAGTINAGTITAGTIDLMKAGTLTALQNGTITAGTLSNLAGGSIVVTAGTIVGGTVQNLAGGSIVVTAGTMTAGTVDILTAGTLTALANGTITAGTINSGTLTAGTIDVLKVGTIATGTVNAGTIDVLKVGTISGRGATGAAVVGFPVVVAGADSGGTTYSLLVDTSGRQIVQPANSFASNLATVVIATPGSAGTLASSISGLLRRVTVVTPDMESTNNTTVRLIDSKGGTVVDLAAQAESKTTSYGTVEPMTTDMSWTATSAGTESTNRDIILDLHYER